MMTPWFEKDAQAIMSAQEITGSTHNTSILKVGLQPGSNTDGPFAGVQLLYTITQTGGATDSDVNIDTHLVPDGTNVCDAIFHTIDTVGATSAAAFYFALFFLAAEPNYLGVGGEANEWYPPIGAAIRQTLSRHDGDRTLTVTVNARRFWWAQSR